MWDVYYESDDNTVKVERVSANSAILALALFRQEYNHLYYTRILKIEVSGWY